MTRRDNNKEKQIRDRVASTNKSAKNISDTIRLFDLGAKLIWYSVELSFLGLFGWFLLIRMGL